MPLIENRFEFEARQNCASMKIDALWKYSDILYANGARWITAEDRGEEPAEGTEQWIRNRLEWHQRRYDAADTEYVHLHNWIGEQSHYAQRWANPLPMPTEEHLERLKVLKHTRETEMLAIQELKGLQQQRDATRQPSQAAEARAQRAASAVAIAHAARNI